MRFLLISLIMILIGCVSLSGRKIKTSSIRKPVMEKIRDNGVPGSFMVSAGCDSSNNGYTMDQIVYAGYEKKSNSKVESIFVSNHTDSYLIRVCFYIDYLTPDSLQLDRRFRSLDCEIPPGETRKLDMRSWDTQNSFRYISSPKGRSQSSTYIVKLYPVSYYLRFND